MSFKSSQFLSLLAVLALTGCGSVTYQRARLEGQTVSNPSLGRGVAYQVPPGYALLNPWSPVPPKPENAKFEYYLRSIVATNDKPDKSYAFRESLLYRSGDRYLVVFHVSLNTPKTFRSLRPENRARLYPFLAEHAGRYFGMSAKDYQVDFIQHEDRTLITFAPFRPAAADEAASGWQGTGYGVIGDLHDVIAIFFFARSYETSQAVDDSNYVLDHFHYGPAPKAPPAP